MSRPPIPPPSSVPDARSRRAFLRPAPSAAQRAPATSAAGPTDGWTVAALRLARRITYGITPEVHQQATTLGFRRYLDVQLDHERIDDAPVEDFVAARYPLLAASGAAMYDAGNSAVFLQLQESTIYRAAFSRRQLYERMVEFWSDHFTIWLRKVTYLKLLDDREVIRKHALGKFPDLLRASTKSPAMLVFLDQQSSRRQSPNQNYARELLELHTMGADGGYTQQDVAELSRALTGWGMQGRGEFLFNPTLHDFGEKTVLGRRIAAMPTSAGAQGVRDGETVVEWLITHPSTARFVSTKMLRWLLQYEPTAAMVARVAGVYTSTGGDIRAMIRACLDPAYLTPAPAKLKRPFHFLVSGLRALAPATVGGVAFPNRLLTTLGQPLFMWETPDGYPDQLAYWAGNLLPRWNVATSLANLASGETTVDVAPLARLGSAAAVVEQIDRAMFGRELSDRTQAQLVAYLRTAPTSTTRIRETLALALSSAEFQWY